MGWGLTSVRGPRIDWTLSEGIGSLDRTCNSHLYMAFQLLQNMASGHVKVKKGLAMYFTWPFPVTLLRVYKIRRSMVGRDNIYGKTPNKLCRHCRTFSLSSRASAKNGPRVWHPGYWLKPEVWRRVGPDPRAELQVDLEIHHFVLHHPNRRTVIRLAHHIMANRDIIKNKYSWTSLFFTLFKES